MSPTYEHYIAATIISGKSFGRKVCIPRIPFQTKKVVGFTWQRRQLPVRLAFSMSINKSMGQTLKNIGVYLPEPVFSHGHLYVALSRVGHPSHIKVFIKESMSQGYVPLAMLSRDDESLIHVFYTLYP